jgi:predicted transcriptional regulator
MMRRKSVKAVRRSSTLPKRVQARVEHVARRLRKPRRVVLEEAVNEYAARHDPDAITEAMNRVADAIDTRPDAGLAQAARSILERTEW